MEQRIYLKPDLVLLLRMSGSTIDRRVRDARKGLTDFPVPISAPGQRLLWDKRSVDQWLANRANATTPVVQAVASPSVKARDFAERQKRAAEALARHGFNRNGKGGAK